MEDSEVADVTLSKAKGEKIGVSVVAKQDYVRKARGVICTEVGMEVLALRFGLQDGVPRQSRAALCMTKAIEFFENI